MTTLEKIRAEILNFKEKCNASDYLGCGILDIIDKYAEQEPTDEWQNGYDRAWEEAEVFYEQEPCDDVVSRQAVLEHREILRDEQGTGYQAVKTKYIRELPSVRQHVTGKGLES